MLTAIETTEMNLVEMKGAVNGLLKSANQLYRGKAFQFPLNLLEEGATPVMVTATVKAVDLQEDTVELTYELEKQGNCWSTVTLAEFHEHAVASTEEELLQTWECTRCEMEEEEFFQAPLQPNGYLPNCPKCRSNYRVYKR